jgi:hypothetical protein
MWRGKEEKCAASISEQRLARPSLHQALAAPDDLGGLLPVLDRLAHTAAWGNFNARVNHRHLRTAEGSRKHQLVHVPQVPNAEDLGAGGRGEGKETR